MAAHGSTAGGGPAPLRVGVLGSGLMGAALGRLWAARGHAVAFSYARDPARLDALAQTAGATARAASPGDAVRASEVVLVAVPWHRLDDALAAAGGADAFAGRVVVTCSLPMTPDDADLAVGHTTSGAEELARRLPGARVVAAFNTVPSELLREPSLRAAAATGAPPAVGLCGDDAAAKRTAAALARDAGLEPVDAGSLGVARWVEPFGLLMGHLAYARGLGPALGYRLVRPAPGGEDG